MDGLEVLHGLIGREGGDISAGQMSLRAVVIFAFGVALVRAAGKRVFGKWGAMDIILSVVIGSNLSRAMTGSAPFLETLVATAALVAVHGVLAALAVRLPALGPLLKGRAARILLDGRPDEAALKRHGVGRHDLEQGMREAGVTGVDQVAEAWIERDGGISVLKR